MDRPARAAPSVHGRRFCLALDIGSAISQIVSSSLSASRAMPPGMQPSVVLQYNASNVTVAQLTLSGSASEEQLFDWGLNFFRVRLFTVPGLSTPAPYGGKQRQIVSQPDQEQQQQAKPPAK